MATHMVRTWQSQNTLSHTNCLLPLPWRWLCTHRLPSTSMRTRPQPRHTTRTDGGGAATETIGAGRPQYTIWAAPARPGAIVIVEVLAWTSAPPPRTGGITTSLPVTASVTNIGPLKRCGSCDSCDDWRIHAAAAAASSDASPWAEGGAGAPAGPTGSAGIGGRCANASLLSAAAP